MPEKPLSAAGLIYALLAYVSWGLIPLYWKPLVGVLPWEVLSHRAIWSVLVLAVFVVAGRQGGAVLRVLQSPRNLGVLVLTAALLSTNWALFIYGVISGQVVQTSLGYFLLSLVNVLFACVFLKERLTRWQWVAVLLAACGVIYFGWHLGRFPWIAVGLSVSFGFYGLLRKMVAVGPLPGMLVETTLMVPAALVVLMVLAGSGHQKFGGAAHHTALLLGTGLITTLPLLWFNCAAKRLPYATMGFLQYVAPSLQLAVGVWIFREPFTHHEAVAFALIWAALTLYIATLVRRGEGEGI